MTTSIQGLPQSKLNHLQVKLLYTLFFLALYRMGVHVPLPGVDAYTLSEFFKGQGGNLLGMFNMLSGGALQNFSIFALGVMPYITASIIAQVLTNALPYLEALSKEGESGRRKINQYTRYGTVVLALVHGFVMATTIEHYKVDGQPLVLTGGIAWKCLTVLSLAAGTAFVMWLGEQITERGVGNGISLVIFAGIVANLPGVVANTYASYTNQQMDLFRILMIVAVCIVVVAWVVYIEQGARQIPVEYAKRQVGRRVYSGQASALPIKVNTASVIPPIFASSLLQLPLTVAGFATTSRVAEFVKVAFMPGEWLYNTVYVVLIIGFAFFYTSFTFRADDVAENLKKHGGYIPGIRPGVRTAEYLQKILDRLTLFGALYLSAICVLPSVFASKFNVQFYFGGTSLLIVVGVALETFRQIDAHRQSLRYEAFLKKGVIRPRGGTA